MQVVVKMTHNVANIIGKAEENNNCVTCGRVLNEDDKHYVYDEIGEQLNLADAVHHVFKLKIAPREADSRAALCDDCLYTMMVDAGISLYPDYVLPQSDEAMLVNAALFGGLPPSLDDDDESGIEVGTDHKMSVDEVQPKEATAAIDEAPAAGGYIKMVIEDEGSDKRDNEMQVDQPSPGLSHRSAHHSPVKMDEEMSEEAAQLL